MRNKGRFEYVDELRKISTIQKMGYVQSFYPQDFEEHKQEVKKFIRYKQELVLEEEPQKQHQLFGNNIIQSYKKDEEDLINEKFANKNEDLTKDIGYYHNWSQSLNQQIKERDYKHRFYFKHARPPPRVKEEPKQKNKKDEEGTGNNQKITDSENKEQTNEDETNIQIPHRGKYNFPEITKFIFSGDQYLDKTQGNFMRDTSLKDEITEYRKLKNLSQIEKIGGFHQEFKKFQYYIEPIEELYEIDFIDNSIAIGNNNMKIDFFRDIGSPSRDIMKFTLKHNKNKIDLGDINLQQEQNAEKRQNIQKKQSDEKTYKRNRDLLYLYFLNEDQLKINKSAMTFQDVANISMRRITPYNSYMCVRNEKITLAQYEQLISRMKSENMKENDGAKPKEDKEVGTQQIEENNFPENGEELKDVKETIINLQKIIEEINKIKRQVRILQNEKSKNNFDRNNFNTEVYKKLKFLLSLLYDRVTEKTNIKYPFNEINFHLEEIKGSTQLGYDRIRVLLFIANSYDEIFSKQKNTPDLRDLLVLKAKNSKITTYKGNKVLSSIITTNQLDPTKEQVPVRDRLKNTKKNSKVSK